MDRFPTFFWTIPKKLYITVSKRNRVAREPVAIITDRCDSNHIFRLFHNGTSSKHLSYEVQFETIVHDFCSIAAILMNKTWLVGVELLHYSSLLKLDLGHPDQLCAAGSLFSELPLAVA